MTDSPSPQQRPDPPPAVGPQPPTSTPRPFDHPAVPGQFAPGDVPPPEDYPLDYHDYQPLDHGRFPPPGGFPPPPGGFLPPPGGFPPPPGGFPPPPGGFLPPPGGFLPPPGGFLPPRGDSGFALASLVCSLTGLVCCGITSIVGVVLAIVAMNRIRTTGQGGQGLALAGLIVGVAVTLLWSPVWIINVFNALSFTFAGPS